MPIIINKVCKPTIFAKFTGNEILGEKGRLLFTLLHAFSQAGYPIQLFNNLKRNSVGEIGSQIFQFPNLSITEGIPQGTTDKIFLYDERHKKDLKKQWIGTVRVRFDIFSSFWRTKPILFPFPVHPVHISRNFEAKLSQLRENTKSVKLFFSGDMKGYNKNHITFPEPKLPRLEIVNMICKTLPDRTFFLEDNESTANLFAGPYSNNCVIIDTSKTWVDDKYWLDYLARTDFFLAPPGIVLPMCHNIIEAMAVGAIPVTNYPEWFNPKLEHLKNCIAFSDKRDLVDKINLVLNMDQEKIKILRQNVIRYYEKYLTTHQFIHAFEAMECDPVYILMFTERYVKNNANKLNKNSFIIKGTSNSKFHWQKLLRMFN